MAETAGMWIKLCGMTRIEAVHTAVELQVNAIGFVFAPSKRQVSAEQACELARAIPASIQRVAVMLHPTQAQVDEVLQVFKPDVLQTDWNDLGELRLPTTLQVLPVLRASKGLPEPLPIRFLFEGPVSGTGETADWRQAAQLAQQGQLLLAGGLSPANVATAIAAVRPFGVDVSSGIESAPGVKDRQKMIEFVEAARAA